MMRKESAFFDRNLYLSTLQGRVLVVGARVTAPVSSQVMKMLFLNIP